MTYSAYCDTAIVHVSASGEGRCQHKLVTRYLGYIQWLKCRTSVHGAVGAMRAMILYSIWMYDNSQRNVIYSTVPSSEYTYLHR